jgi:hypothetical protein
VQIIVWVFEASMECSLLIRHSGFRAR